MGFMRLLSEFVRANLGKTMLVGGEGPSSQHEAPTALVPPMTSLAAPSPSPSASEGPTERTAEAPHDARRPDANCSRTVSRTTATTSPC